MRILQDSARVRVFEPDPAAPSGAVPIFGEFQDKLGRRAANNLALSVVMTLLGIGTFFLGMGLALPVWVTAFFGCYLAFWIYCATTTPSKRLKSTAFRRLDCDPDGLVEAGNKVGVRLPDGRWLHLRMPLAWRLQLAGQRRLWLLGIGDRVFATLPGNLSLVRGRVRDVPPPGAAPAAAVSREPVSPDNDRVLGAHRRFVAKVLWINAGALLVFAALMLWARFDSPGRAIDAAVPTVLAAVLFLTALLVAKSAADNGKPLTAGNWTELRLVPDGPLRLSRRGLARLSGRTTLADGREVGVRLAKVDPSMAANIAVTGQLWVVGMPKGGLARVGVPGYPVTGLARFLG